MSRRFLVRFATAVLSGATATAMAVAITVNSEPYETSRPVKNFVLSTLLSATSMLPTLLAQSTPEISKAELKQLLMERKEKPFLLVDVREFDEVSETGCIPSAVILPLSELQKPEFAVNPEARWNQLFQESGLNPPSKDTKMVVYCYAGVRATFAAELLQLLLGYSNISVYTGSFRDWIDTMRKPPLSIRKLPKH